MPVPGARAVTYYQLYNEDCFETFKRLKPNSIDLVLVDPPYGTTQCKWDSIIPLKEMWEELNRITKPNSPVLVMATQPFTSYLVCSNIKQYKYSWVWDKMTQPSGHLNAKKQPMKRTEDITVFCKSVASYYPIMWESKPVSHKGGQDKSTGVFGVNRVVEYNKRSERYPIDLICFQKVQTRTNRLHPTQKPVDLMEYLIKTYSNEGDTVLDFAMGSGTTGVACGNLGRRFIGCDSDVEHGYFQIAQQRIEEAYASR